MLHWKEIDISEFLSRKNKIRVKCLHKFYDTDTKVHVTNIKSPHSWREYSSGALLPWYKHGLSWSNSYSSNYTPSEYARLHPSKLWNREIVITSVYHTLLNTRLLVDGCHRAVAIESEINRGIMKLPNVKIVEAYGAQVHVLFTDFGSAVTSVLRELLGKGRKV